MQYVAYPTVQSDVAGDGGEPREFEADPSGLGPVAEGALGYWNGAAELEVDWKIFRTDGRTETLVAEAAAYYVDGSLAPDGFEMRMAGGLARKYAVKYVGDISAIPPTCSIEADDDHAARKKFEGWIMSRPARERPGLWILCDPDGNVTASRSEEKFQ